MINALFFAKILLMLKRIFPYFTLIVIVCASTLIVWLPFLLRVASWYGMTIDNSDMGYVYKNFDGPLYIIPAKTLYKEKAIEKIGIEVNLSPKYFAAHLPLYPILIRLFAGVFGYLKSMLFVNVLATIVLVCFFYFFVVKLKLSSKPLILASVFLFIPKFLVVRTIGAPESLFILLILVSLYFFTKEKYWLSGLFGGLATTCKTPGILLFAAYGLAFLESFIKTKKINWNWFGIVLIPLGLFAVFGLYAVQYNDFFAYFHTGGFVPMPYPFSVFNFRAKWVSTAWLEEMIFYFFLYALTVYSLKDSKYRGLFYFSLVFFVAILFVQHRDIPRYTLPLWPLACVAFEKFFTSKKFLSVFGVLLIAVYLYAWNFILFNIMPISNWKPYL